jgi:hypothetical protein
MNNITKVGCQILRDDINKALAAIGLKHNVKFNAGSARFTDKTCQFKLDIAVIDGETGKAINKDMEVLKRYKGFLGLKDEDFTKTFVIYGKTYKLAGYVPRKYTKPFVLDEFVMGAKVRQVVAPKDVVLNALRLGGVL